MTFNCGLEPVTIAMDATAKLDNRSHQVIIDGGGKVTLDGGGKHRILYLNACDPQQTWTTSHCTNQQWPQLIVKNLTLAHGADMTKQTASPEFGYGSFGGGAIYDLGGRLAVSNSLFVGNRCYRVGPDLGGGAIRALAQWHNLPVSISHDTFRGGRCSNGGALSSILVSWTIRDSTFVNNRATGHGTNPARAGSPGGGSGGAIYSDSNRDVVKIIDSRMSDNRANELGGAVFYVSNDRTGRVIIKNSTLRHNPSLGFWTRPYPGIFYLSGPPLVVVGSTIK